MTIRQLEGLHSYWDIKADAIPYFAQQMRDCTSKEQREELAALIARDIGTRVQKLSDKDLVLTAVSAADDLYKAADATEVWDAALARYLAASADTFSQAIAKRGYIVHYLIDNTFQKSESGMRRPLFLYPDWFHAAGFAYICPQHCASLLMSKDGISPPGFAEAIDRYDAEARHLALGLVKRCHAERRHYVFLDADSVPGTFTESEAAAKAPGVVTICRNDAPFPGSQIQVTLPKSAGLRRDRTASTSHARKERV